MTEVVPRITYSPEGILEIKCQPLDERSYKNTLFDDVEVLAGCAGYEISEEDQLVIKVEVPQLLRSSDVGTRYEQACHIVNNIHVFTYDIGSEDDDVVFDLTYWGGRGAGGQIYPQFQRWLNAMGLDEDAARHCIESMALPFGQEGIEIARKDFIYDTDGKSSRGGVGGFTFGAVSRRELFGIEMYDATETVHKMGKVEWNWIDLQTIGSCACWGAEGVERDRVHISPQTQKLYEMHPHNVDGYNQSLSLVLGAAALAYYASEYPGREDILADAQWQPPRD